MSDCNNDALGVRIDRLERDVVSLQGEQKDQGKMLNDVIISLEKNQLKQTIMMEQLVERDKEMSENIKNIGSDVDELKKGLSKSSSDENKSKSDGENKIATILANHIGKIIITLLIILLTIYGIDASKFMNL